MPSQGLLDAFVEARPALLRFLLLRGAAADEAEDILQEISLKLSAETIGPVDQPRAYLYRMAANHFLLHRRAAERRTRREAEWVGAEGGERPDLDEHPSAEAGIIARERLAALQRVLDALPERTRTIFRRFRLEGAPQRQIAAEEGVSLSAVEKHLTRAYEAVMETRIRLDGDSGRPRHLKGERGRDGA